MIRTQQTPEVWRAFFELASSDARHPGRSYSPQCLLIVRFLAYRPGATSGVLCRVHAEAPGVHEPRLRRLERLGLVCATGEGHVWQLRWHLTARGREFVDLIDREGVV